MTYRLELVTLLVAQASTVVEFAGTVKLQASHGPMEESFLGMQRAGSLHNFQVPALKTLFERGDVCSPLDLDDEQTKQLDLKAFTRSIAPGAVT